MAAEDNEAAERPVREQFKKASIAGVADEGGAADAIVTADPAEAELIKQEGNDGPAVGGQRGRLQKKRSFEEIEGEDSQRQSSEAARGHTRKRSRDSTVEEDELKNGKRISGEKPRDSVEVMAATETNGDSKAAQTGRGGTPEQTVEKRTETAVEAMASPKIKRSRLHSNGTLASETATSESSAVKAGSTAEAHTADTESSAPDETSAPAVPPLSGFANTSSSSPFGTLAGNKSPPAETSESAFKASGFGALAGASSVGFGAVGKSTGGFGSGGSFATGAKSPSYAAPNKENEIIAPSAGSAFGGGSGQQSAFAPIGSAGAGFGGTASGFGKLGQAGGFGALGGGGGFRTLAGGTGLATFASGKPNPLVGSSRPTRGFGSSGDDEERDDEGGEDADAGYKSPLSTQDDPKDERFYEQEVETGEEDESTQYSCRAKLYNFATVAEGKKEWRERGLGVLRLNVKHPDGEEAPKARFLMRADGSHRVVLNTPVKKEIKFGAPTGGPPQGGFMYFMGTIDGKSGLELLQLKIRQQFALELYDKVVDLQSEM